MLDLAPFLKENSRLGKLFAIDINDSICIQ